MTKPSQPGIGEDLAVAMWLKMGERVAQLEGFLERKLEGEPEPEPDYEALGYPETRVFDDDLDTVASWVDAARRLIITETVEYIGDGSEGCFRIR